MKIGGGTSLRGAAGYIERRLLIAAQERDFERLDLLLDMLRALDQIGQLEAPGPRKVPRRTAR
jgi:hypothetical protein